MIDSLFAKDKILIDLVLAEIRTLVKPKNMLFFW